MANEMVLTEAEAVGSLRRLYLTRVVVQVAWAVAVLRLAGNSTALAVVLLAAYPAWDVLCTVYDLRRPAADDAARRSQWVNAAVGVVTAAVVALTAASQPRLAIAAFGAWALLAGLLQLVAGVMRRKRVGGQWFMMLSGAQSCLAGVFFVTGGLSGKLHVRDLAGYAVFGAVYFLLTALLLGWRRAGGGGPAVPVSGNAQAAGREY